MLDEMFSLLDEAKHRVVHEYKNAATGRTGAVALAPRVRMNPGTLSNKVNPTIDTHHLTLDEAVALQLATNDTRLIEAEANVLGGVFIRLPSAGGISDLELLNHYSDWQAFIGRTCESIHDALADGDISAAELREIKRRGFDHIQRFFKLLQRLEAISGEG